MSHPLYSSQQLLNRGMAKVKQVAADLGVLPTGDKRIIQNWVDAIVNHQAATIKKVEIVEAAIHFESESFEGLTQPYMVVVGGQTVERFNTYAWAETHCKWKGYQLVDSQSLAQSELEVALESQAVEVTQTVAEVQPIAETPLTTREDRSKLVKVIQTVEDEGARKFIVKSGESFYTVTPGSLINNQKCECPDCFYRSIECKHQLAVSEDIASKIQFISPNGHQLWEAVLDGQTIAKIEEDIDGWGYWVGKEPCNSYAEAVIYIRASYAEGKLPVKPEIKPVLELENGAFTIEPINTTDHNGKPYGVSVGGRFIGYIWQGLGGWTVNGDDWCEDWVQMAGELSKSHYNSYLVTV